jgi:hypothetical protein
VDIPSLLQGSKPLSECPSNSDRAFIRDPDGYPDSYPPLEDNGCDTAGYANNDGRNWNYSTGPDLINSKQSLFLQLYSFALYTNFGLDKLQFQLLDTR